MLSVASSVGVSGVVASDVSSDAAPVDALPASDVASVLGVVGLESTPGIEKSGLGGGAGGVVEPLSTGGVSVPASCAKATSRGVRIKLKQSTRAKSFRRATNFKFQIEYPRPIIIEIDPYAREYTRAKSWQV